MWWDKIIWKERGEFQYPVNRPLEGQSVVIIGGGPSLTQKHVKRLHSARYALLTNNAFLTFNIPHPVFAADRRWWGWHGKEVIAKGHLAISCTRPGASIPGNLPVMCFEKDPPRSLCEDPMFVGGRNSGHAAANAAIHFGAKRVYLAGFDMGFTGGRSHWHDGHRIPSSEANYVQRFRPQLENLCDIAYQKGIIIAAITPSQAKIPHVPFATALKDLTK